MTTKHTPGPWKWIGSRQEPKSRIYLSTPNGYANWMGKDAEEAANARLIAAAPELAEALRALLELGRKDTSNPKYDGYYEIARQALSKAGLVS